MKEEDERPMALDEPSQAAVVMDTGPEGQIVLEDTMAGEQASQQPLLHEVGHLVAADMTERVILIRDEPPVVGEPASGGERAAKPPGEEPGMVPEETGGEGSPDPGDGEQQPVTKRKSALRKSP